MSMRNGRLRASAAVAIVVLGVASVGARPTVSHRNRVAPRFKAVAFDYFVLFNPDSVIPAVDQAFPGRGRELTNLWRTRQFEYAWLRSITGS